MSNIVFDVAGVPIGWFDLFAGPFDQEIFDTANNNVSVVESGSAADTTSAANAQSGTTTESGSAVDTTSASAVFASITAESGSAADLTSALAIWASITAEAGSAADATSATAIFAGSTAESGSAADTPSASWITTSSTAESGSAADTSAAAQIAARTTAESGSAADSTDATVGGSSTSESGSASDSTDATLISGAGANKGDNDGFAGPYYTLRKNRIRAGGIYVETTVYPSIELQVRATAEAASPELLLPRLSGDIQADTWAAVAEMLVSPFEAAMHLGKVECVVEGSIRTLVKVDDYALRDFFQLLEAA